MKPITLYIHFVILQVSSNPVTEGSLQTVTYTVATDTWSTDGLAPPYSTYNSMAVWTSDTEFLFCGGAGKVNNIWSAKRDSYIYSTETRAYTQTQDMPGSTHASDLAAHSFTFIFQRYFKVLAPSPSMIPLHILQEYLSVVEIRLEQPCIGLTLQLELGPP